MVNKTVSRGRKAGQQAQILTPGAPSGRSRERGRGVALGVAVVVAAGAVAAWRAGAFSPAAASGSGQQGAPPPATQPVVREDLSATTPVTATLGYAGSYTVTGEDGGTLTSLPSPGRVISQGQALYRVGNASPVVLLYGIVPDWRAMSEGTTGADVSQLNHDLVTLGYADRGDIVALGWDYYSWETACAVQKLEEHLGVSSPPGSLSLGQVVFEPEAIRVAQVTGHLGALAAGPVLTATSDRHVVTISLDAADQSEVKAGDAVSITLPDGASTPGVVSSVGTVATASSPSSPGGSSGSATVPVQVKLTRPQAAGTLDQAPVTVYIATASASNVLAVPVTALVAQVRGEGEAGGGYEVEVVGSGNTRRWVPVQAGPVFDDNSGLVQVTGALTPGERVVVASS
jgi:hypothetical protein